ncbi:hypothetical protein T09_13583 [Trichinella sp. T9]|nr:hypothetical protein T09_13583 [Trichinella sp. T9]
MKSKAFQLIRLTQGICSKLQRNPPVCAMEIIPCI